MNTLEGESMLYFSTYLYESSMLQLHKNIFKYLYFLYRFWLELNGATSTAIYKPLRTALLQNLYFIATFVFQEVII